MTEHSPRPVSEGGTLHEITVTIDEGLLPRYSDEFLAFAWHLAQHNPAPFGDYHAGELATKVGWEIIHRWLKKTPVEMFKHQQKHNYSQVLGQFAQYVPPPGSNLPNSGIDFHAGSWTARPPKDEQKEQTA